MERALATSAQIERDLARELGPKSVVVLRQTLTAFLRSHGALAEVMARRARPVW